MAPGSVLCQVLSPPTASEPVKSVIQLASNVLIQNVMSGAPPLAPTTAQIALSVSKGENSATAPVDATGQSNKPATKMYCN